MTRTALLSQTASERSPARTDHIGSWLGIVLLVLLPFQRLHLPFGLAPVDIMLLGITGYALVATLKLQRRLTFPLLGPIWLILIASVLATLVGFGHFDSAIAIMQELYLFGWFLMLTNWLATFPRQDIDRLMKVWSIVACIVALTTVMGMFRLGPTMFYVKPDQQAAVTTDIARAVGTFANANAAAVYLSVSFFILLATSWPVGVRVGLGLWLFMGMLGTGSNGALFSSLFALGLVLVLKPVLRNRRALLMWGAVLAIGISVLVLGTLALIISEAFLPDLGLPVSGRYLYYTFGRLSRSFARRLDLIAWAGDIYAQHPWGTGPNSYATLLASLHNDYAAFLFERGPLGLLGWLWIIIAVLTTALRTAHTLNNDTDQWAILSLAAGFLACAINAFTHEISHMRQVWLLLVFLFALSLHHKANLTDEEWA